MNTNTNEIKIEQVKSIERLEECAAILIEAYNRDPWFDAWTPLTGKALLASIYNAPDFMGWIATSGNQIVGCCIGNIEPYYTGRNFFLKEMFIAVKSQKLGIGKKLLAAMKQDIESRGVKLILLLTRKVITDFYTKSGFSQMEEVSAMMYRVNN